MDVAILALPHCAASSVHGLLDILTTANYCHKLAGNRDAPPLFKLNVVTPDDHPVKAYNGSAIVPTAARHGLAPDLIVAASAIEAAGSPKFLDQQLESQAAVHPWLQARAAAGSILATACTGSFLLAEAGLLDGKTVTTHWRSAEHFRHRYPGIHLEPDRMLIDNGNVISAGGATAFIDLSFHLIERFGGSALASACAKLHVFDHIRQDQAPYRMFAGHRSHSDDRIKQAQDWIEQHYAEHFAIDEVADRIGLGARTFKRRFREATGETPIGYLQQVRIEAAKHLLETTRQPLSQVIWASGYEDVSSFRRLFKRTVGCTMEQYRKRFSYVVPQEMPRVSVPVPAARAAT
ncbi:MAG: helix-turn-helix domain-containing protein [Marinobacter sp.]|uniref:GlxA family transcriptional regulator n=1 Tax=Marinobacter sp. TaxID=50741 RepID=UPI00299E2370|nr:helix-turn-helix domain-containing protein [Marinobacter sp.]MDX1635206.1 helix-turn-helix domain-containing protein [Marinobacter sp.]